MIAHPRTTQLYRVLLGALLGVLLGVSLAGTARALAAQPTDARRPAPTLRDAGLRDAGLRDTVPSPRRVVVDGVNLTGVGYDQGSPTAPIVLVNFSDFACPYCATFARDTYPALANEFVRTGQLFFKYVPFAMGTFLNGKQAARASECAAEQGRFWPMHDRLYARQPAWTKTIRAYPVFREAALHLGLDDQIFSQCYDTHRTDRRTEAASIQAKQLGIRATPTFYLDGQRIEGALPLAAFQSLLRTLVQTKAR